MKGKMLKRDVLFKFTMYSHVACTGDLPFFVVLLVMTHI
jgi:hypothetical protein